MPEIADVKSVLQRAAEFENSGAWDDAIGLLTERNLQKENVEIESRILRNRHKAFLSRENPPSDIAWPRPVDDLFPDETGIPEVPVSELDTTVIASAIQYHGALLVRGLINAQDCDYVRKAMDAALDARATLKDRLNDAAPPWHRPFRTAVQSPLLLDRVTFQDHDTGLAADSPRTFFRHLEALKRAGFTDIVKAYFGEGVGISANKSTLRRTPPNAPTGWHQDGVYFGKDIRALNLWTAYSPCGVDAAGLELVSKPLEDIISPDSSDFFDQAISHDAAKRISDGRIVRPTFNSGDGILFDHLTLHRTSVDESMSKIRYAIEMWHFAASTYPDNQIPLLL